MTLDWSSHPRLETFRIFEEAISITMTFCREGLRVKARKKKKCPPTLASSRFAKVIDIVSPCQAEVLL
jgi:hypothetical protein